MSPAPRLSKENTMPVPTRPALRARDDEGMVTAEAAAVIPSLLLVLTIAVAALVTVHAQMKAVDASREAARLAARGESTRAAVLAAERLGPAGARVVVRSRAQRVEAVVTAEVHPLPLLPAFTVRASTTAEKEQP
jgi:Flp pilus assembly protein TadG